MPKDAHHGGIKVVYSQWASTVKTYLPHNFPEGNGLTENSEIIALSVSDPNQTYFPEKASPSIMSVAKIFDQDMFVLSDTFQIQIKGNDERQET